MERIDRLTLCNFKLYSLILNNTKTEMFIFKNQIVFFDSRKQDNAHVFQKENDPV